MTMPPPPPPPPGWYPDSSGGSRYWDGSNWGPLTAPSATLPPAAPISPLTPPLALPGQPLAAPTEVKKKSPLIALLIAGAVLLLGGAGVAAISNNNSGSSSSSGSTTPWPTVTPEELQAQEASKRALLDPSTYEEVTPREFALIAKDPEANSLRKIVLYGVVTQFDPATGAQGFRASTDGVPHPRSYDFDQNTILVVSDPSILKNVVEKDFVTLWVSGAESYTYDTQIGGSTTVPKFTVNIIKVTGSSG